MNKYDLKINELIFSTLYMLKTYNIFDIVVFLQNYHNFQVIKNYKWKESY